MTLQRDLFVWFTEADQEIIGSCYCSRCSKIIDEDEVPLMLFRTRSEMQRDFRIKQVTDIARFHDACATELIEAGIIKLVPTSPAS